MATGGDFWGVRSSGDQESRLGRLLFEKEKTLLRVSPFLFLTLGLERRLGSNLQA